MRSLAVALLLLTALVSSVILLATAGAEASPATYTVNSTADPGDGTCDGTECTLREAITAANANAGTDTIAFNIAGAGPHTISPGSALPTISDPLIIDGTSEPDFAGSPIIELDGSGAGLNAYGLYITAGSSTVKGLVINRFQRYGIRLSTNGGNTIEGNFIGTDVTGTADLGNGSCGLIISSPNNTIGGTAAGAGNVISGNGIGVRILDSTANVVLGNLIGTDVTGTAGLGNDDYGVYISSAPGNTIGGTTAGAGNVISGNHDAAVMIAGGPHGTGNHVQGNYIGTDVTGTADLGNFMGVRIQEASGTTIGGTTAGAGNVISGNHTYGVLICASGATGNHVQGNYIGTDATGSGALSNPTGVLINGSSNNTIGGTTEAARNVISGNGVHGVVIQNSDATGNQVQGNYIGTDATGSGALANGTGVLIEGGAQSNIVGGTASGEGNVIAYNGANGIEVDGASTTLNPIRANSIHSSGGKGIENLDGGNMELAPPIIDSVGSVSGHTDPKCYPCTVEIFCDDEDEGRIYKGSTTTNDDATGTWTYPDAVTGPNITATITDADGNTSEFSTPVAYPPPVPVGGIAELPEASGSAGRNYAALAGLATAALAALSAGAWYARRRWVA